MQIDAISHARTHNTLTGPKWPNSRGLIFHGVRVSSRPPQLPAGSCLDNQNHAKTAGNTPFEHCCCSKGANRMKLPGDMQAVKICPLCLLKTQAIPMMVLQLRATKCSPRGEAREL